VRSSGVVYWGAGQIYVSHLLKGEYVGMEEIDDGVWDIYFGPIKLGGFNVRDVTHGVVPYWSVKTCNLCP
jgi:putative transposase